MKSKIKNQRSKILGFTMIELLIVIAVLGVLAVAVLSAINPIEQINRSRDTGSRADAEQLLGAIDRYYTSMGWYPWFDDASCGANCSQAWISSKGTWTDGTTPVLDKLSTTGTAELKAAFVTRIRGTNYNAINVYNRGTSGDATYACFLPKSASFQTESYNRCNATLPDDYPTTDACPSPLDMTTVWACLP